MSISEFVQQYWNPFEWQKKVIKAFETKMSHRVWIKKPRQTGKTTLLEYLALAVTIVDPPKKIGIICPSSNKCSHIGNDLYKMLNVIGQDSQLMSRTRLLSELNFTNGSSIYIKTPTMSIRGASFNHIFIDDTGHIDIEFIFSNVLPCLRAEGIAPEMIALTTDPYLSHEYLSMSIEEFVLQIIKSVEKFNVHRIYDIVRKLKNKLSIIYLYGLEEEKVDDIILPLSLLRLNISKKHKNGTTLNMIRNCIYLTEKIQESMKHGCDA